MRLPLMFWCGVSIPGLAALAQSSYAALPIAPTGASLPEIPTLDETQATTAGQSLMPQVVPPETRVADLIERSQPLAQRPDPNRDRFPQPLPTPQPVSPAESQPSLTPAPTPTPTPAPATATVQVNKIEVQGSTVLGPKDFNPILQKYEGQALTVEQLRNAADAITQLYLDRGYITSRAILANQTIADGVVRIQVIEGSLEGIEVQGLQRLRRDYVVSRIQLGATPPLSQSQLEDQLRLLKADPLFENVEASLRAGTSLGKSVLVVRVTESRAFNSTFGIDNYSPPSVGSERLGGAISYRNVTGLGDEISASYFGSTTGGSNAFDFVYRVPVNPMNGTLQFRAAPSNNRITASDFRQFDIRGNTDLFDLSFRQPLIRTPREEFALSLAFTYQNGQTFLFNNIGTPFGIGPDINGNSRTRVLKFGQDYVKRDPQGAWALRSQFNFGADVFGATTNADPVPDGRFFSWLGQFQRVQRLGNDHLLIAQLDVQLTPHGLLPSQQFVIGGGQSVRGYRQNARTGDNGFRFSVEDRIALMRDEAGIPTLQVAPFIDMGTVWNVSDNPNRLSNETFLIGGGLALIWEPYPRWVIRLDYGLPFITLSDRGNNAQDRGFYFSVSYSP